MICTSIKQRERNCFRQLIVRRLRFKCKPTTHYMLTNHFYPLSKPVIPMICEYKDTEKSKIFVLYLVFYSITPISRNQSSALSGHSFTAAPVSLRP